MVGERPCASVADHAYELYLVHVPVFAIVTTYRTGWDSETLLLARLGTTIGLAVVLHQLVEPVRRRRWLPSPRLLAGTLVGVILATGVAAEARASHTTVRTTSGAPPIAAAAEFEQASQLSAAAIETVPRSAPKANAASSVAPSPEASPRSASARPATGASAATAVPASTTTQGPPQPDPASLWIVGDSTLRELDDPDMTHPILSEALTDGGWKISGVVGLRALATCGPRPLDDPYDDLPATTLPAVRDGIREWFDVAPAAHVLVQLGSNDIAQFDFDDDELRTCLTTTLDALPPEVGVWWVVPPVGPWCWCDLDDYREGVAQFAALLSEIAADRPNLRLIEDALSVEGVDLRSTLAEDGVHATELGRVHRVGGLVERLGPAEA